jgi:hypothetical protein
MRRRSGAPTRMSLWPAVLSIAAALSSVGPAAAATPEDPRDVAVIIPLLNGTLEIERTGTEVPWSNSLTGRSGIIRIERTFYRGQQPCRDYTRTTRDAGASFEIRGIGCRIDKMKWQFEEIRVNTPAAGSAPTRSDPDAVAPRDLKVGTANSAEPPRLPPPVPVRKPPAFSLPTRSQL